MILLRPADPTRPIIITNAVAIDIEDPPEGWLRDVVSYVIESTNVTIEEAAWSPE